MVGDSEPCIYCEEGTSTVVDVHRIAANPCEWDPLRDRPARDKYKAHAEATVVLGCNGAWRLCPECAALSIFKRFRVRKLVKIKGKR